MTKMCPVSLYVARFLCTFFSLFFFWEALPGLLGFYFLHAACRWTIQEQTLVAVFHHLHHTTLIFFQCDQYKQLWKRLSFPVFKSVFQRQGLRHQSRWHELGMSKKLCSNSEKLLSKPKLRSHNFRYLYRDKYIYTHNPYYWTDNITVVWLRLG